MPTADVSVRPAVPGDEVALTSIQRQTWAEIVGDEAVDSLPTADITTQWAMAITNPPSQGHRVLVACAGSLVTGFVAVTANGDVIALEVAPDSRRAGHGSRLLAAAVDHLRERGAGQVRAWALEQDTIRIAFLTQAGLGEGGAKRGFDTPQGELHEVLYAAQL